MSAPRESEHPAAIAAPASTAAPAALPRADRAAVLLAVALVCGLCWAYLAAGAGMEMMARAVWTPAYAGLMFAMWWIMMIAMMLPSALPMLLLFARLYRGAGNRAGNADGSGVASGPHGWGAPTFVFAAAYAVAWAGFSLVAVAAQWGLEAADLISPMLQSTSPLLGGLILIAAGLYQLTPLKQMCLRHCRNPLQFLLGRWRDGAAGAFRMGLAHGAFCVGCCWFLMALLFFGGVMNLMWIAGLTLLVLLEKTLPAGRWLGAGLGVALLGWGGAVLAGTV